MPGVQGAVRILTKMATIQHTADGICVNSVHPDPVLTAVTAERYADEFQRRRWLSRIPLGRMGLPEGVAYGFLYLASDESSFVTGSELVVGSGKDGHPYLVDRQTYDDTIEYMSCVARRAKVGSRE